MEFDTNSENKISLPLSPATTSNNLSPFNFILLLSEGRASETWEPSKKICSFSPQNKLYFFSHDFTFYLLFYYSLLPILFSEIRR
jgi:hypothetical protein